MAERTIRDTFHLVMALKDRGRIFPQFGPAGKSTNWYVEYGDPENPYVERVLAPLVKTLENEGRLERIGIYFFLLPSEE